MKRVSGYVSTRPLGCFEFEFFVEDHTSSTEIQQKVDDLLELDVNYSVEEGYVAKQETVYRKKSEV